MLNTAANTLISRPIALNQAHSCIGLLGGLAASDTLSHILASLSHGRTQRVAHVTYSSVLGGTHLASLPEATADEAMPHSSLPRLMRTAVKKTITVSNLGRHQMMKHVAPIIMVAG